MEAVFTTHPAATPHVPTPWENISAPPALLEPAGALAVAARSLLSEKNDPQQPVVCVVSGSNHDVPRYAEVIERSLVQGLAPLCKRMTQTGIRYELLAPGSPLQRFLV